MVQLISTQSPLTQLVKLKFSNDLKSPQEAIDLFHTIGGQNK